jgi:hypothetical protein
MPSKPAIEDYCCFRLLPNRQVNSLTVIFSRSVGLIVSRKATFRYQSAGSHPSSTSQGVSLS